MYLFQVYDTVTNTFKLLGGNKLSSVVTGLVPITANQVTLTADVNVVFGNAVKVSNDLAVDLAQANTLGNSQGCVGLTLEAANATDPVLVITGGVISFTPAQLAAVTENGSNAFLLGSEIVLSTASPGKITWSGELGFPAAPGEVLFKIGRAIGNQTLLIEFELEDVIV